MDSKFIGTYYRALDSKGRLLLPPRFLDALGARTGASCWLTMLYGRITAYLPSDWENIVGQLCGIRITSLSLANFKTRLIGMAHEVAPDGQGRIRIPQALARAGGLQKDIVIVGIVNKFEIWDQARFEAVPNEDVSGELEAGGVDIAF